jgi:hypothetical protein
MRDALGRQYQPSGPRLDGSNQRHDAIGRARKTRGARIKHRFVACHLKLKGNSAHRTEM